MSRTSPVVLGVMLLFAVALHSTAARAQTGTTTFATGSWVVPMDTTYQNTGMLRAYGLVYRLLRAGVPIRWVIEPTKAHGGVDFTVAGIDHRTRAVIASHGYRGGPFVIAAADTAAARPIVDAWQALYPQVAVHETSAPFTGFVARHLVSAPTIAVFADGNETIAFGYMNAAGIPDSADRTWPAARVSACTYGRPDVMCESMVAGGMTDHDDGTLFDASGTPLYCQMMSMHWNVSDARLAVGEEVIREYRSFLSHPTHLFAECQAVNAIENSVNAHFLTSSGFLIAGRPTTYDFFHDDVAYAQLDGTFASVGGSEPSYSLPAGSSYLASDTVMISGAGDPVGVRDVWMTGYLDGTCDLSEGACGGLGKVSYLGGHRYDTAVPISSSPDTQGTRLFLNALFEADCATADGQPSITLVKSAPAIALAADVTFTLDWTNNGRGVALDLTLRDAIPAGSTFVSATAGGTFDGTSVTWRLGAQPGFASGAVSFTVRLGPAAHYPNRATATYFAGTTPQSTTSNTTDTAWGLDQDGDGILDVDELVMGFDPLDSDMDDDGISDGAEAGFGTDPLDVDTDGDGLADGFELGFVRNCAASCHVPPRCASAGTAATFVPDGDCTSTTDPLDPFDPPRCADGLCDGAETCSTCAADCGTCPPPPATCGDSTCNGAETCATCAGDCGACPPVCGDGSCNGTETCATCAGDCGSCPPMCGDTTCNGAETCSSCATDCGTCPAVCGDGACAATESCASCATDCGACPVVCGDGACTGSESCGSCAIDCGACPPACGDGTCNGAETCAACASDCGACASICGDGACSGAESCADCAADCGACSTCGDGVCGGGDTCATCAPDCGTCPGTCGDGTCDSTEDCTTCTGDCGTCPVTCGNGTCEAAETCSTCAGDCGACPATCGNAVCEAGESCSSCAIDCGSCTGTCGDSICDSTETCVSCALDCGACVSCGDGVCGGSETCTSCASDCGACSSCGDGACAGAEDCTSCASDCGDCPTCGDGTCGGAEDCTSCAGDCGSCPTTCGDGTCGGTESCSSCEDDCGACPVTCGDGTCAATESCASCAADCACPDAGGTDGGRADGGPGGDSGVRADAGGGIDAGPGGGVVTEGGCGCHVGSTSAGPTSLAFVVAVAAAGARRRRRPVRAHCRA